jgi:hypothetical protein
MITENAKWAEKAPPLQKPQGWATQLQRQKSVRQNSDRHSDCLEVEGPEGNLLCGDQQLAKKFKTERAAV